MAVSFSELRAKEVIRLCDAACIGCVTDVMIDAACGRICALCVMPVCGWSAVFSAERTVIPWEKIRCIGADTVLADVTPEECAPCGGDAHRRRKRLFRKS